MDEKNDRMTAINKIKKKDRANKAKVKAMTLPKIGDEIYVPTALHLSRGRDDVVGGLATVTKISKSMSGGEQVHFISVKEIPGGFNWEQSLALKQDELKDRFGNNRAYPDPDNDPNFNEP